MTTTAADALRVGGQPDALAFNIDRAHYRFHIALFAFFALAVVVVMLAIPIDGYLVTIPLAGLLVFGLVLASIVKILLLPDPVLLIDRHGIFDRRVTREVVPWSKIKHVDLQEANNDDRALPNSFLVKIDVGSRRGAEIALAPWTYFDLPRYWQSIGWDDLAIDVQGLAVTPNPGEPAVASRIVDYARAMLARYGHAGKDHSLVEKPGITVSELRQ